jgi:hypothetical protein
MIRLPATELAALVMSCCALLGVAHATDPLPAETRIVAATGAPTPTQLAFTITPSASPAPDLVVTLTDLQIPGALTSAGIVVTQAGAIAGSAQLASPATSATFPLPAASGDYVLYVFGLPNANYSVGTFSACVAPKSSPSNCIQSASLAGNITAQGVAKDPTVSTSSTTLAVATAGSYTFTFGDLQFPVALNSPPNLALFQGSVPIIPPGQSTPAIASGTVLTLSAGTYQLLAIAQADPTAQSGLYDIMIAGPAGAAPLLNVSVPVGLMNSPEPFNNPSAQPVTLTVTDYAFPGALSSASALLTAGATVVGNANASGGAVTLQAPAGALTLWTYGSAGSTPGTFSVDVSGSTDLYTTAQGVSPAGSSYAYAYVTPTPLTAGAYQATAADLQFPSQLTGLSFAVAQNGVILQKSATAATVNFTAAAGNAVLLVGAQTPASGSASGIGLFDVNIQSTGASAQLVYDKTQSVSSSGVLLDAQTLNLGVNASFDATLTDLAFPAAFDNLAFVVSRGSQVLGKIYGGGKFSFAGSPGNYQLTFVATPAADQQFGVYGVAIVYSPPAVTLTSNVTTAATGTPITLNWTVTNATSCTASGGTFTGSEPTSSGTTSVVLAATTTYELSCTGTGGTTSQSVSVTATAAAPKSGGGGGSIDPLWLLVCTGALVARERRACSISRRCPCRPGCRCSCRPS